MKQGNNCRPSIEAAAAALFDGGWRSADLAELQTEYKLDDKDTKAIVAELARFEGRLAKNSTLSR